MIVAACGLLREARLIARTGIVAVAGGGDPARLERDLDALCGPIAAGRGTMLSFGLAGALAPGLHVGDVVIDESLRAILPTAHVGRVVGQDSPAATVEQKRHLHATTGALAVDMESHVAERVALRHGLRFATLRVISDDAARALPPAALVGMRADGGMALGAVLASLARSSRQLPALIRTGRDAERAFAVLRDALRALEAHRIRDPDLLELRRDV